MRARHTTPCRHLEPRLAALIFGELDATESAAIELHLEFCDRCRNELEQLRHTLSQLQSHDPVELTDAFGMGLEESRLAELAEAARGNPFERDIFHPTFSDRELFAPMSEFDPPRARDPYRYAARSAYYNGVGLAFFSAAAAAMILMVVTVSLREPHAEKAGRMREPHSLAPFATAPATIRMSEVADMPKSLERERMIVPAAPRIIEPTPSPTVTPSPTPAPPTVSIQVD